MAKKHTAKELERFIELYLDGVPFRELRSEYGLKISPGAFNMYFLKFEQREPSYQLFALVCESKPSMLVR